MPLPDAWVDRLFERLALVYGRDFLSRWEGLDLRDVKADWARELSGWERQPHAIRYALEHLPPDKPPTVLQFRAICNSRPEPELPRLPAPVSKPDPAVMRRVAAILRREKGGQNRSWAAMLRDVEINHGGRFPNGALLTPTQREMWRKALPTEITE
jgi:hypothetical protein